MFACWTGRRSFTLIDNYLMDISHLLLVDLRRLMRAGARKSSDARAVDRNGRLGVSSGGTHRSRLIEGEGRGGGGIGEEDGEEERRGGGL